MKHSRSWIFALAILCASCGTVPQGPQSLQAPPLSRAEQEALERDFIGRMQNFLQGKLPQQPDSKKPSSNAVEDTDL
jgi:hypothetical protein